MRSVQGNRQSVGIMLILGGMAAGIILGIIVKLLPTK